MANTAATTEHLAKCIESVGTHRRLIYDKVGPPLFLRAHQNVAVATALLSKLPEAETLSERKTH